jgi:heat-inducible transcriptional repressor
MLTERQNKILKTIVEDYIKSAQPVSSKKILEDMAVSISSATIRSECVVLEEEGYLEKQHTSSGRIPSTKGYRYYVDHLMEKSEFSEAKKQIEKIFATRNNSIDEVLEQTSKIISEMTNLASVFTVNNKEEGLCLSKVELVPISEMNATVLFVLSNGTVHSKVFMLNTISLDELKISIDLFNERLANARLSEIETRVIAIRPILEKQVKKYDFILQTFVNTILHSESEKTKATGMQYLLANPEFDDPVKIKQVIQLIENSSPFKWFDFQQKEKKSKTNVAIGIETGTENDDISIVGLEINQGNGKKGTLALVGPKRLDYDKVSNLMEYIDEKIEEQFGKGNGGNE